MLLLCMDSRKRRKAANGYHIIQILTHNSYERYF